MNILSIDIGGSNIKATVLDKDGAPVSEYKRLPTPVPSTPANVMATIEVLLKDLAGYDAVSAGFPGYVRDGVIKTAPNLGTEYWKDYNLQTALSTTLKKPAKVVNDADLQGIAVVSGKGLEMVITLGTGFGTALLKDGRLLPHLEIGQHPIKTDKTYDMYIGQAAFEKKGKAHWNERLKKVINILKTVYNYDRLYISGGNAKNIDFKLDDNIALANNRDGIKGGALLWREG
ncbi:MAG: ROK family protein [Panacibacter sp.]